jgi:hypothetical protein
LIFAGVGDELKSVRVRRVVVLSRSRVVVVLDLEFLRSWGLGVVIRLRAALGLAFACHTRTVCAAVVSLVLCVLRIIRPQVAAFSVLEGSWLSSFVLDLGGGSRLSWISVVRESSHRSFEMGPMALSRGKLHVFACVCILQVRVAFASWHLHAAFACCISHAFLVLCVFTSRWPSRSHVMLTCRSYAFACRAYTPRLRVARVSHATCGPSRSYVVPACCARMTRSRCAFARRAYASRQHVT